MNKRTDIDFSKHQVIVTQAKGQYGEELLVHHLILPSRSSHHAIKYINTCGIMAVSGDFGNWIFCREFHPSPSGRVDGSYWDEKAHILSSQETHEWDSEETAKNWSELLVNEDHKWTDEEKDYIQRCIAECGCSEMEYNGAAIDYPRSWDPEYTSACTARKRKFWLNAVYDGFDEICNRMKAMEGLREISSPIPPRAEPQVKAEKPDKWITIKVEEGDYVLKSNEVPLVKSVLEAYLDMYDRNVMSTLQTPGGSVKEAVSAQLIKTNIGEIIKKMTL